MYTSKFIPILVACALLTANQLYARRRPPSRTTYETRTITGTITDQKNGEPLVGVSVAVKGTSQGTLTDINGKFSISVPDKGAVLFISYTGYAAREITITGKTTTLSVQMILADRNNLDEVLVVGYGTQKKGEVTSAIASVKSDKFTQG